MSRSHFIVGVVLFVHAGLFGESTAVRAEPLKWDVLHGCEFIPHPFNDGDRFHVRHQGKEYIFRLYYVDTAETMTSLNQRMSEQASYWGLVNDDILKLGKEASSFTARFLSKPFSVQTCWQRALGRSAIPRHYAFVSAFGQDLGEALVRNGLAQVFGEQRRAPPGFNMRGYLARLLRLETEARKFRRGAWSMLPPNHPLNANRGVRQTSEGAAYVLVWDTPVFSGETPPQRVGTLRENSVVWLLEERPDLFVRLRYEPEEGPPREFLARRDHLGLPASPVLNRPAP
mgnify:CR=1 FL=1